jgi:hypothetical protein
VVLLDHATNKYEASTLRAGYMEYNRLLQNTPIFSNIHKLGMIIGNDDKNM